MWHVSRREEMHTTLLAGKSAGKKLFEKSRHRNKMEEREFD
jgi:hypothetical protein